MPIPFIGAALAVVAPVIKDVVMDVVKDVAMDIGKQFVDTIGKGIKDVASEVLGKGAKVIGDVIKNPLDALKDLGKKLIPPGFQQLMDLGKTVMQAATNILQKFLDKIGININININVGGAQGAQAGQGAQGAAESSSASGTSSAQSTSSSGNAQSAGGTSNTQSTGGTPNFSNMKEEEIGDYAAGMSGADLEKMQLSNPKGFREMMKGMSTEDRGLAMQQMQMHLQSVNQMISMMTNMAQIQHDTTKAVINNLRV